MYGTLNTLSARGGVRWMLDRFEGNDSESDPAIEQRKAPRSQVILALEPSFDLKLFIQLVCIHFGGPQEPQRSQVAAPLCLFPLQNSSLILESEHYSMVRKTPLLRRLDVKNYSSSLCRRIALLFMPLPVRFLWKGLLLHSRLLGVRLWAVAARQYALTGYGQQQKDWKRHKKECKASASEQAA